eukprot:s122_g34.t1
MSRSQLAIPAGTLLPRRKKAPNCDGIGMPIGRSGSIKAAVVKGSAPLLVSRTALQTLQAVIDFGKNELTLFVDRLTVPLTTNAAGQYIINVLDKVVESEPAFAEVMMNENDEIPVIDNVPKSVAPSSEPDIRASDSRDPCD